MLARYLAWCLGVPRPVAEALLGDARGSGARRPVAAATLFVVCTAPLIGACVPRPIRQRLILRFLEPIFSTAAPGLAYLTADAGILRGSRAPLEP